VINFKLVRARLKPSGLEASGQDGLVGDGVWPCGCDVLRTAAWEWWRLRAKLVNMRGVWEAAADRNIKATTTSGGTD